jgi:hypothetical protein
MWTAPSWQGKSSPQNQVGCRIATINSPASSTPGREITVDGAALSVCHAIITDRLYGIRHRKRERVVVRFATDGRTAPLHCGIWD